MPDNTAIEIKEGTETIVSDAFLLDFPQLTSITFPGSLKYIGARAFLGTGLTSVSVPESVVRIGARAFLDTPWFDNQPDGVIYFGRVLYGNKGTLADSNLQVREGTEWIAGLAFYNTGSITNIALPGSVTSIGDYAFNVAITSMEVRWANPSMVGFIPMFLSDLDQARGISYYSNQAKLIVPKGTKSLYESAPVWCDFATIEEGDYEGVVGIHTPSTLLKMYLIDEQLYVNSLVAETISIYSLNGNLLHIAKKATGESVIHIQNIRDKALIVKGSSGWSQKIIQ
jgi:hypothetical protein